MATEMTPQERAAATRLCIDLLSIIHSDPHPIDEPCGQCLAAIRLYAQETRRAALLDAAQMIEDDCYGGVDYFSDADTTLSFTDQMKRAHNKNQAKLAGQVRKLAQEG